MAKKHAPKSAPPTPAASREPAKTPPPPFITAGDLNRDGNTRFRIEKGISIYQRNDGRTALFVHVMRQDRTLFTLSVNCNGPDRIALDQQCGRNLLDWPGKVIELFPQAGSRGGQFVNVFDPNRPRMAAPVGASTVPADDDIPF